MVGYSSEGPRQQIVHVILNLWANQIKPGISWSNIRRVINDDSLHGRFWGWKFPRDQQSGIRCKDIWNMQWIKQNRMLFKSQMVHNY